MKFWCASLFAIATAEANASYVIGSYGAPCPSGASDLTSESQCGEAAAALGRTYGGSVKIEDIPRGCLTWADVQAGWNAPSNGGQEASTVARLCQQPKQNIVELAKSVAHLSTLVAAVVAGDLVDTLSSGGPFTVFAPTNEGFAALPAGTLDSLMKPENNAQLANILLYHVLPEKVLSSDLQPFQTPKTAEGKKLQITVFGPVRVGPSLLSKDMKLVTAPDNMASNGVVHIIDGVLLPPSEVVV